MPAKNAKRSPKKLLGKLLFNRKGGGARLVADDDQLLAWLGAEDTANALHGDQVEATPTRGDMARVTKVVGRENDRLVGTYQKQKGLTYVLPDDPRIAFKIILRPGGPALARPPQTGDKVVVKLETWKDLKTSPAGQLAELLGAPDEAGVDMLSVIRTYNLPGEFPAVVMKEANAFSEAIPKEEIAKRDDCRSDFVLTIDPDDAKDHDDAVHVYKTKEGWLLSVHIADVAHYVRPGSALDREARERGNSTYLADRCIPMLPLRLSADLCSLREGVDRLAHTAFIEFTPEGKTHRVTFAKTIIRVAKRLTYREAKRLLDTDAKTVKDPAQSKIVKALHTAWELATLLRKRRFAAGSLDLEFPETKIVLDADGRVERIEKVENDESHQLIEEFMLAANEAVGHAIKNRPAPCIYRVHDKPDPERLEEFRKFAAVQGLKVGDMKVRKEVQRMLDALHGRLDEHVIKVEFLKSLRRAAYSTDPIGHYGLAKADYLHFTSPIRRYADLVAHRVLAHERGGGRKEFTEIAQHLSDTERNSAYAEQDSKLLKKMEYFQRQLAAVRPDEYRAIVTDVRSAGLLIEVPEVDTMGIVNISLLKGGPYEFDRARGQLIHRRSGRKYGRGDTLKVSVCRVDAEQRQIDFAPV